MTVTQIERAGHYQTFSVSETVQASYNRTPVGTCSPSIEWCHFYSDSEQLLSSSSSSSS